MELDVLGIVSERLSAQGLAFMLTGSFALAHYATPRMTRDIDLVVEIAERDVDTLVRAFARDFYVDGDAARTAIRSETLFNLMHLESGIKVDLIVRKDSEYRAVEFARRRVVDFAGVRTSIVAAEDLILSKLIWARETNSDLQRRDVLQLLASPVDLEYVRHWAVRIGVSDLLESLLP